MRRAALLGLALGLWAAAGTSSCFSPRQPVCAFSCVGDGRCPTGYTCSVNDGWCHRDDAPDAACSPSQLDAGSDAQLDAGSDAQLDAGSDAQLDAGSDAQLDTGGGG